MVSECGDCQVASGVPERIRQGYAHAAGRAGMKVSPHMEATVAIQRYRARETATRMLIGAFAGRDEIQAAVRHGDQAFAVEDYYANAWMGIDDLAFKIGEMIFEKMK